MKQPVHATASSAFYLLLLQETRSWGFTSLFWPCTDWLSGCSKMLLLLTSRHVKLIYCSALCFQKTLPPLLQSVHICGSEWGGASCTRSQSGQRIHLASTKWSGVLQSPITTLWCFHGNAAVEAFIIQKWLWFHPDSVGKTTDARGPAHTSPPLL